MEEIKVGEYFRTRDGYIGRIEKFLINDPYFNNIPYYQTDIIYKMPGCYHSNRIYQDMMTKHSPNIIDLIEVGDYVNGYIVVGIVIDAFGKERVAVRTIEDNIYSNNIKSIVTKEQMKSIEYEV